MKPHGMRPFPLPSSRPPLWQALSMALLLLVQPALVMAAQLPPAAPAAADADLPPEVQEALRRAEELAIDETAISVEAKAEALGSEIGDLFAFVRDEIGFEPYRFLLRGPEGTLVAGAGNSVDQAYLLEALCRHHGLRCRVVQGTLTEEQASSLIASLFSGPVPAELLEGIPDDASKADPTRDPELLAEVRDHYWVQWFDEAERRWVDLDPASATSTSGAATEAQRIVTEPSSELSPRLSLEVHLEKVEDGKPVRSTPLTFAGSWAELVMEPVHLITNIGRERVEGRMIVTGLQPALAVGKRVIEGETAGEKPPAPGAENLMSRAADLLRESGSAEKARALSVVRQWVEFTLRYPDGREQTWSHQVFTDPAEISERAVLLVSLSLTAGDVSEELVAENYRSMVRAHAEARRAAAALDLQAQQSGEEVTDWSDYVAATALILDALMTFNGYVALTHAYRSDVHSRATQAASGSRIFHAEPRVLITASRVGEQGMEWSLDLAQNRVRTMLPPATPEAVALLLYRERGIWESALESVVLRELTGGKSTGALAVLERAKNQGVQFAAFTKAEQLEEAQSNYSATAIRAMQESLDRGNVILVPERMVDLEGGPALAWWEFDSRTGEPIVVSERGGRQTITMYAVLRALVLAALGSPGFYYTSIVAGFMIGFGASLLAWLPQYGGGQTECSSACALMLKGCEIWGLSADAVTKDFWSLLGLPQLFSSVKGCQKGGSKVLRLGGCPC